MTERNFPKMNFQTDSKIIIPRISLENLLRKTTNDSININKFVCNTAVKPNNAYKHKNKENKDPNPYEESYSKIIHISHLENIEEKHFISKLNR